MPYTTIGSYPNRDAYVGRSYKSTFNALNVLRV